MNHLPDRTRSPVKTTRSPVPAPGGSLLALGVLGLSLTLNGCSNGEGTIELKAPPTVAPGSDAPQRGPNRAGAKQRAEKPTS
jgi:hypothetical protein